MKRRPSAAALLIKKVYDAVHMVLWASLVAFVSWFVVFVLPKLPDTRARTEMARDHEIAAEVDLYCGKLGMGQKTPMYQQCISYLQEYRAKVEQRIADENVF